jgi:hypothetical protein
MKTFVFLFVVLFTSIVNASSIYTVDNTQLTLSFDYGSNWYYYGLKVDGKTYMETAGSGNGSVIRYSPNQLLAGTLHGNLVPVTKTLVRNGIPTNFANNQDLVGNIFTFSKTDLYNDSYRVSSTLTLVKGGFDQHITFAGYNSSKTTDYFYATLGSRVNRLTNWAAYDADGNFLVSGVNLSENNTNTYLPTNTRMVAQYDPISQDGIITRWIFDGNSFPFIVDRSYDNKLYLNVMSMTGPANKNLDLVETVRIFKSNGDWISVAPLAVPEPSTMILALVGFMLLIGLRKSP